MCKDYFALEGWSWCGEAREELRKFWSKYYMFFWNQKLDLGLEFETVLKGIFLHYLGWFQKIF